MFTARVHGRVYGPRTRLCTGRVHDRVQAMVTAVYSRVVVYTAVSSCAAVYTVRTRPCRGRLHGRVLAMYTRTCTGRVHGRRVGRVHAVYRLCTRIATKFSTMTHFSPLKPIRV